MLFKNAGELLRSGFRPRVHIVGSGPAGLSLALRLQAKGVPCLVIEAGAYDFTPDSQNFYRGSVVGDRYHELHEARLRQFGGTSGHWSGWVCTMDASDFEPRDHVPNSGWPIRSSDLQPYAAAADEILEVKPHRPDRPMTRDVDYIQYRYSPPVRFGDKYRERLEQAHGIGLLLNTPVLELLPGKGRIDALRVAQVDQPTADLPVDQVCICTGGIENSRLLLWSNQRHGRRVVPNASALGRFWMEHPVHVVADVITVDQYEAQFENTVEERWLFAPSDVAKKTHRIGGAHIWMRVHQENPSYVKELLHEALCLAPQWSNQMLKRFGKEYHCGGLVQSEFEQFPLAENCIELGSGADALGVPQVRLHWRKSEAERRTALISTRLLGEALVKHNIGRMRIRNFLIDGLPWPLGDQTGGWHHMGGTRMSDSPSTGVVDRDSKVFGMANLYVGGASVFTTGGHASPTYTVVQLALRLGDHLGSKLRVA